MNTSPNVAVVVGNPKPASRTLEATSRLARDLVGAEPQVIVDLATLGPGLLHVDDADVGDVVAHVAAADLVVVGSPTYKATYTGLLKLFLDRFAPGYGTGLTGLAVPFMLGAGPGHALAPELLLRPVLTEIGGLVPVPGLYVLESEYDAPDAYAAWLERARPVITTLLDSRLRSPRPVALP